MSSAPIPPPSGSSSESGGTESGSSESGAAGIVVRFCAFIAAARQGVSRGLAHRERELGLVASVFYKYLQRCANRLGVLQARFAAGTLPAAHAPGRERPEPVRGKPEREQRAREQRAREQRAREQGTGGETEPGPSAPASAPGPRFVDPLRGVRLPGGMQLTRKLYMIGWYQLELPALVQEPEMLALLAASPEAGRILRGLWRRFMPEPLPPALRLPQRPRRRRTTKAPVASEPASKRGAKPGAKPAPSKQAWPPGPDGRTWPYPDMPPWEFGRRLRARRARAGPKRLG